MVFPPSPCVREGINSSRGAVVADDRYDVVIVGTGAGGTLAHRLAATGSFFPSIDAVNPSLTAIANALRIGDHLACRLG
jgi:choline dehydrogenase-like flavoprotein